ncbi:MAG: hypothetical protein J6589_02945 [Snodgrassella sp.]|uniref:hypothetical protein n=1 Tax=Snodgrassella sp. TaxID=2815304 RepID=UPI002584BD09|nr:hypothetical protein [Snodgrassella sp.]MCO6513408.1 hypothetical protein [Snodgrassella sp.]
MTSGTAGCYTHVFNLVFTKVAGRRHTPAQNTSVADYLVHRQDIGCTHCTGHAPVLMA